jgi:hypothetical protein
LGFLELALSFDTTPISRFLRAFFFLAFTDAYDMKVLVSSYQSIDMHCIMVPVKFDDGLTVSFLRKKQIFTKKGGGVKSIHFQKKLQFSKTFPASPFTKGQGIPSEKVHFSPE